MTGPWSTTGLVEDDDLLRTPTLVVGAPVVLTVTVKYLASATGVNITLGGGSSIFPTRVCALLDPSTGAVATDTFAQVINNPLSYAPAGPFTADTVWTLTCRLPAGAGANVPVTVIRSPDRMDSGDTATISYRAPTVSGAAVFPTAPASPLTATVSPVGARLQAKTDGSSFIVLTGACARAKCASVCV